VAGSAAEGTQDARAGGHGQAVGRVVVGHRVREQRAGGQDGYA